MWTWTTTPTSSACLLAFCRGSPHCTPVCVCLVDGALSVDTCVVMDGNRSVEGCGFPKDCFRQNEVEAILGGSRVCVCDSTSDADGDGYQDCVDDCPANAAIVFGEDANADGLPDCDSRTLWMEFAYTNAVLVSIVCVAGALGALVLYSRTLRGTVMGMPLGLAHLLLGAARSSSQA